MVKKSIAFILFSIVLLIGNSIFAGFKFQNFNSIYLVVTLYCLGGILLVFGLCVLNDNA